MSETVAGYVEMRSLGSARPCADSVRPLSCILARRACSVGFASCLVSRLGCHIVWQLSAADFKHPCLKPLGVHFIRHPCPPSKKGEVLLLGQAVPTVVGIEVDRTSIPPTFRRVRDCVCLVGFASLPCLLLPLQRTSPCSHNHCKRTTHHRSAQRPCLPCQREVD